MIEDKLTPKAFAKYFGGVGLEETQTFDNYDDYSVEGKTDEPPYEL